MGAEPDQVAVVNGMLHGVLLFTTCVVTMLQQAS